MSMCTGVRPRLLAVVAIATTALLAAGCTSAVQQADARANGAAAAADCRPGGTLVAASSSAPQTNRILTQQATNLLWVRAIFEPLMTVSTSTIADPKPLLARSWDFSDGGRTAVLHLRDDVKFQSGRPFTAQDVLFTFTQALNPINASNVSTIIKQWTVTADGDHQVTITSPTPLQPVLGSTLDMTPIVDSQTWADAATGAKLVGTGPYELASYTPGAQMVLTKNPDYWQPGVPHLDRIEIPVISDSTAQVSALRSGRTQFSVGLTAQDAKTVTGDGDQFALVSTIEGVYPIVLDKVADQRVRQAIAYAIDRDRINEQVYGGLGRTDGLYWAKGSADYPADLAEPYAFDPAKAKQLIQDAGAAGTEVPITIINLPVIQSEYQIIANNLTDIGLRPVLTSLAPSDYQQRLAAGGGGNFLALRGLNGTASFMLETNPDLRLAGAHRQTTAPEYTALVGSVLGAADDASRATAVRALTTYLNDQAVVVPLVTTSGVGVRTSAVQGVAVDLMGWDPVGTCFVR